MSRVNGFRCDGCDTITNGIDGPQYDPGPFLPPDWWGAGWGAGGLCFCPTCKARIKAGALHPKDEQ